MLTDLTLKRAKELSSQSIGRLPRTGYEVILFDKNGYRLTLVNRSGKLELSEYLSVNNTTEEQLKASDEASKL